jgi:hypothetical protein
MMAKTLRGDRNMTFPVKIEHGNHAITAHLHALPRPGDRITCEFPSSGIAMVFLVVTGVNFHQPSTFEGKECPDPFWIAVTTDGDPDQRAHNEAVFEKFAATKE